MAKTVYWINQNSWNPFLLQKLVITLITSVKIMTQESGKIESYHFAGGGHSNSRITVKALWIQASWDSKFLDNSQFAHTVTCLLAKEMKTDLGKDSRQAGQWYCFHCGLCRGFILPTAASFGTLFSTNEGCHGCYTLFLVALIILLILVLITLYAGFIWVLESTWILV